MSPSLRSGLSAPKPLRVTTRQPRRRAIATAFQNIPGAAAAGNGDQQIALRGVQIDLLGEDIFIAQIVAQAGQHRAVIEGQRAHIAVLGIIGRHMAADAGAAAIADEHQLAAVGMGGPRPADDAADGLRLGHFTSRRHPKPPPGTGFWRDNCSNLPDRRRIRLILVFPSKVPQ